MLRLLIVFLFGLAATRALAADAAAAAPVPTLTVGLAVELAPRVPLFAELWARDPDAILVGEVVHDYLFALRGWARDGVAALKERTVLDSRAFLPSEDAVVLVASKRALKLPVDAYGVRRLEVLTPAQLEERQRHGGMPFPADRLRLGRDGFRGPSAADAAELLGGRIAYSLAGQGPLARAVPALRAIDLIARSTLGLSATVRGEGEGDGAHIETRMLAMTATDRAAAAAALRTAAAAVAAQPPAARDRLREDAPAAVRAALKARTDRRALRLFLEASGAAELFAALRVELPVGRYLLPRSGDAKRADEQAARLETTMTDLLVPPAAALPNRRLYYGAADDARFRALVLGGPFEVEDGPAGRGMYASLTPEAAAARAGSEERVVALTVSSDARLVDVTGSAGKGAFERFGDGTRKEKSLENFGEALAVDVLRFGVAAGDILVLDESVLESRRGFTLPLQSVESLVAEAGKVRDAASWEALVAGIRASGLTARELPLVLKAIQAPRAEPVLKGALTMLRALWSGERGELPPVGAGAHLTGAVGLSDELDRKLAVEVLPRLADAPDRREDLTALLAAFAARAPERLANDFFLEAGDIDEPGPAAAWEALGASRKAVVAALKPGPGGAVREARAAKIVDRAAHDPDRAMRMAALAADQAFLSLHGLHAAGGAPCPGFVEPVLLLMADPEPAVRREALQRLMYRWQVQSRAIDSPRELRLLLERLDDEYETVHRVARRFFAGEAGAVSAEALAAFVASPDGEVLLKRESGKPAPGNAFLRGVLRDAVVRAGLQSEGAKQLLAAPGGSPDRQLSVDPTSPGAPPARSPVESTVDTEAAVLPEPVAAEASPPPPPALPPAEGEGSTASPAER